jgi:hypothetical protein
MSFLASVIEWVISFFVKEKQKTHDDQMQEMGELKQQNSDSEQSLRAACDAKTIRDKIMSEPDGDANKWLHETKQ